MTQPVQEQTPERGQSAADFRIRQLARRPPLLSDCAPITFRAAIQALASGDDGTERVHYPSGQGGDNVYFDTWDTTFDTSVYDISDWDFVDGLTGIPSIAGVTLLLPGVYTIKGQVDYSPTMNGVTLLCSNYDDGQMEYAEANNMAPGGDVFLGDSYCPRVDHTRFLFTSVSDDEWDTESEVEIIFAQNNDADLTIYGNTGPGVFDGFGNPPLPGQDVWIPGGTMGDLGPVPHMLVCYWGIPNWDEDWAASFPLRDIDV